MMPEIRIFVQLDTTIYSDNPLSDVDVAVLDYEGYGILKQEGSVDSWIGFRKQKHQMCLGKGSYYIMYMSKSSYDCNYTLIVNLIYPKSTEINPNDNLVNAQNMDINKTQYGMLVYDDFQDTYKLSVPTDGEVSVNINAEYRGNENTFGLCVYNSEGEVVKFWKIEYNDAFNNFKNDCVLNLKKD